jgi:AcrR family transcriptional regulator
VPSARTNDPAGTRRKIVDAAFAAFSTAGYNATGMADIRIAAEVSSGAFSHHFPTKKALVLAVIDDHVHEAIKVGWIEPIIGAETAFAGIEHAFDAIIGDLGASISGCPLNNLVLELSGQDDDIRAALAGIFADWRNAIADKFRSDFSVRQIADINPSELADFVVASYSGSMAMAKASQAVFPLCACRHQLSIFLEPIYAR